jgi:hypothetical protein
LQLLHELQKVGLDKINEQLMSAVSLGYFLGQLDSAESREKYGVCTELVKEQIKTFLTLYHT